MKELMLGNKALARGLYEGGCCVASSYPGTPSTEVTEEISLFRDIYSEWAPNEKVAMEVAFGAALAGRRSMCAMKHVGMNVAADPMYTASYTGVNAGMVIVVADDAGMHSSQNEQDSRHHAIASKLPMLEPSDSAEALAYARAAYELSEEYDTPVIIKMCTRVAHSQSVVEKGERTEADRKPYEKNPQKFLMTPANAIRRHPVVEERTRKLTELGNKCSYKGVELNRVEKSASDVGIICDSTCYQYVKEVFGDKVNVLKIGLVNPLPTTLILDFAKSVKTLWVVEELDPVIENHCRALGLEVHGKDVLPLEWEYSQNLLREKMVPLLEGLDTDGMEVPASDRLEETIPVRPPVMCAGCPHRGLFYTLSKQKVRVMGDIGCYTLGGAAPLFAMDNNLCMGASVSMLHGFNKVGQEESEGSTVAVIGDSTFIHSGMTSLADIAYNMSNSTVIILDNSITGMTGHQQNPSTGLDIHGDPCGKIDLESLVRAMGIQRVRVVDPYDLAQCDAAVKEELAAKEPSVIISRRPCALLKTVDRKPVVHKKPLVNDPEKCIDCKSCMKVGCPAISMKDKKAVIDRTQCIGCGVCRQMCRFDALVTAEELKKRKEG
ncbi:MAG: indolepyruvate ferredoxin oxidoreductase subunit alpha [Lachnospiraceae bacterium]|nr:indolepyruvate ferredoxin oxidoreductase subunit alpha [Lachnospiraceae bacterium]